MTSQNSDRGVRVATQNDIEAIHRLVDPLAATAVLLPKSTEKIREDLSDTLVYHNQGEVIGVGNTVDYGDNLFEIRGLCVDSNMQGLGVGRALVEALVSLLKEKNLEQNMTIFALTYIPGFFQHLGWAVVSKHDFPQKIFKDCEYCARKLDCPETAVEIRV